MAGREPRPAQGDFRVRRGGRWAAAAGLIAAAASAALVVSAEDAAPPANTLMDTRGAFAACLAETPIATGRR